MKLVHAKGGEEMQPTVCAKCNESMYAAVLTPFTCHHCGERQMAPHSGDWHYCDRCAKAFSLCPLCGDTIDTLEKARWVLHHDDPPCSGLIIGVRCAECGIYPDMQSTSFHAYCTTCNCALKDLKCPRCKKTYAPWKN